MSNNFCIDIAKEYLIYGAGGNGLKLISVFEEKGYHLKGFIDKRAGSLENIRGKKVWSLESLRELQEEADNFVIVITTKNVFDHTNIVNRLAEIGFRQCVYKPLPILKGYSDDELEKISRAHDVFLIDGDIPPRQELPKVQENNKLYYRDRLYISQNDGEVLAWMPLELVFNYKKSDAYENLGMAVFFPLDSLYRLFLGIENEREEDILNDFYSYASEWASRNQVEVTEELRESWVVSRKEAFSQMQEISDYDHDFFIRNAPQVEMGNLGKFHMTCSGRNRVVFLAAKGYLHVPVKMNSDDYERWLHKEVFHKIQIYIEKERVVKLFAPVAHPYLKDMPSDNVDYFRLVCFPIMRYVIYGMYCDARRDEKGYCITDKEALSTIKKAYRILCDVSDEGACSRYLNASGFCVERTKNDKFTKLLDELFYQDINEIKDGENKNYDLLITDDYSSMRERISGTETDQIVCIGMERETSVLLKKDGYMYEKTLSHMYNIKGNKQINVYKRDRSNA